jgi:hypothetical protein
VVTQDCTDETHLGFSTYPNEMIRLTTIQTSQQTMPRINGRPSIPRHPLLLLILLRFVLELLQRPNWQSSLLLTPCRRRNLLRSSSWSLWMWWIGGRLMLLHLPSRLPHPSTSLLRHLSLPQHLHVLPLDVMRETDFSWFGV